MSEPVCIVPFGKYKGRLLDEVRAVEPQYLEWLQAQPFVKEKFSNFYLTLVNAGPQVQNSPEHNEMQSRLLDDDYVLCLFDKFWENTVKVPTISNRVFEDPRGWDCCLSLHWTEAKAGYHEWIRNDRNYCEEEMLFYGPAFHNYTRFLSIECKPQIGDDYPEIVRKVRQRKFPSKLYGTDNSQSVVWCDRFEAAVSLEKVRQLFPDILWLVTP